MLGLVYVLTCLCVPSRSAHTPTLALLQATTCQCLPLVAVRSKLNLLLPRQQLLTCSVVVLQQAASLLQKMHLVATARQLAPLPPTCPSNCVILKLTALTAIEWFTCAADEGEVCIDGSVAGDSTWYVRAASQQLWGAFHPDPIGSGAG